MLVARRAVDQQNGGPAAFGVAALGVADRRAGGQPIDRQVVVRVGEFPAGFDGVRRFWGEFLSAWERYRVETVRFDDAGDQVAVVVHIVGRTHELEVDEIRSSLLTVRDGRVVRVQSFADPDAAGQAAGLPR